MGIVAAHRQRIKEHLEQIESAILLGIETRPVTMGFHASACSAELLELYLHKLGCLPIGKKVKHDWFKRPMPEQKVIPLAERALGIDFPDKKKIFELLYQIEEHRNSLIYGRPTKAEVEAVLAAFHKLQETISPKLAELGERL